MLLLQAKANATRLYLKLELLKEKQYSYKQEEIAATKELERLEDAARMLKEVSLSRTANLNFLDLELLANLGQLQANLNFFINSFFNVSFLPLPLDFKFKGSFSSIYLLGPKLPILLGT